MRYGLPVVAFDAGGIREWLTDGENGFLVPWNNKAIFARRIEELLKDKQLARTMGQNGRLRVNRDYASSRQVGRLENLFEEVLREPAKERLHSIVQPTPTIRLADSLTPLDRLGTT